MLVLAQMDRVEGRFRRCREAVEEGFVLGLRCLVLRLTAPERLSKRQAVRQEERCRSFLGGVRGAELCFREGFAYEDALRNRFRVANRAPLLEAKAVEIVKRAAPARDAAFFCAGSLTKGNLLAFRRLCQAFRYIAVEAPPRVAERLCAEAERFGVSVRRLRRDRTIEADAALFYGEPMGPLRAEERCAVVCTQGTPGPWLEGGCVISDVGFRYPDELRRTLPEGFPEEPLFAAAVREGKILPEDIKIDWIQP